jgi:hypothetical protein
LDFFAQSFAQPYFYHCDDDAEHETSQEKEKQVNGPFHRGNSDFYFSSANEEWFSKDASGWQKLRELRKPTSNYARHWYKPNAYTNGKQMTAWVN